MMPTARPVFVKPRSDDEAEHEGDDFGREVGERAYLQGR